jgi:hypothetical protein
MTVDGAGVESVGMCVDGSWQEYSAGGSVSTRLREDGVGRAGAGRSRIGETVEHLDAACDAADVCGGIEKKCRGAART